MTVIGCKTSFFKCGQWRVICSLIFLHSSTFGYLNHKEFLHKTAYKRKHSAECRFSKSLLTETAGKTSRLFCHLEIRGKFDSVSAPESHGLVSVSKHPVLGWCGLDYNTIPRWVSIPIFFSRHTYPVLSQPSWEIAWLVFSGSSQYPCITQ